MNSENAVAWIAQSTMDYIYRFNDINELTKVFDFFVEKGLLLEYHPLFNKICREGLIDFEDKKVKEGKELREAVKGLKEKNLEGIILSGGSPFLAAEIEWYLYAADKQLPRPYFCGNLPLPVQAYVEDKKLGQLCEFALPMDKHPGTLSFELPPSKVMLACPEGRKLENFNRAKFEENLEKMVSKHKEVTVALGGLNSDPPADYLSLVRSIKDKFPQVKIFMGTNSFAKKSSPEIKEYWKLLLQADIISFNDEELKSVYDTLYGPHNFSLGRKLKELEHPGIKICHAAEGAILDPGPYPERIIQNPDFLKDPHRFLQEALAYAGDGATYIYEHSWKKGYPRPRAIPLYTQNVRTRHEDGFGVRFVYPNSALANGLLYVIAPKVDFGLGRTTGAGSFFDGILILYLLR